MSNKINRIFLDLDDVLNRFTMPALHHIGCPVSKYNFDKHPNECGFDIIAAANSFFDVDIFHDRDEFWSLFKEDFWATLPVSSEMIHILDWSEQLVGIKNVYILTSATGAEGCLEGKRKWVNTHLASSYGRRLITCTDKFVCANKHSILFDDSDNNIDLFKKEGGHVVVVPRPWNSMHDSIKEGTLKTMRIAFLNIINGGEI